jgi:hypothetical protein
MDAVHVGRTPAAATIPFAVTKPQPSSLRSPRGLQERVSAAAEALTRSKTEPVKKCWFDPVVILGREIGRLQAKITELDRQPEQDSLVEKKISHTLDDIEALRSYVTTLRPRSIEGALVLISAAFYWEGIVEGEKESSEWARQADRKFSRALWAASEYLRTEFAVDCDDIGFFGMMSKQLNPWLSVDEAQGIIKAAPVGEDGGGKRTA